MNNRRFQKGGRASAAAALLVAVCSVLSACDARRDGAASAIQPEAIATTGTASVRRSADFRGADASAEARRVAEWAVATNDHGARPFAIIDKRRATLLVFGGEGALVGSSPVLVGSARGDDTSPGVGDKPVAAVLPHERTTPAGRFVVEPGVNAKGKPVVWIDYDSALSMHAVINNVASQRRLDRLASADVDDNRISYGCVNVPLAFFEGIALPAFAAHGGIVYVLPETRPLREVFPALEASLASSAGERQGPNGTSTE